MSISIPPKGVYVPVPTFLRPLTKTSPFSQAEVDIPTQIAHSIFLAQSGIRGLVLLGSTGEATHLSRSERKNLVAGVRKGLDDAGFKDYPIMAGVLTSGGGIEETLEWLEDYKEAGAQWGLVLAPGYFGPVGSQEGIAEWYGIVADKSPLPILIYNYPGVTNMVLVEPPTYTTLAKHSKIVGCKMSHGNVSHHLQVSLDPQIDHDKFRVYSGFGQQLGPIVLFGAAGVIDGLAAIYPKSVVKLMALTEKAGSSGLSGNDLLEIQKLQYAVSKAEEFVVKTGLKGIKEAVYRVKDMGNLEGGRLPLRGGLGDGVWETLKATYLSDLEKIEATV